MNLNDVTLLSVSYHSEELLEWNEKLTRARNERLPRWLVLDNGGETLKKMSSLEWQPGVGPVDAADRGSFQHALALNAGVKKVRTRYCFILDPDFLVIESQWIARVTEEMQKRELKFFGAPWHPRWAWQPQQFPCPHFFCVDLAKVPAAELDFTPDAQDRAWQKVKGQRWIPGFAKEIWRRRRFRDTGWRIYSRFHADAKCYENLLPVLTTFQKPRRPWSHRLLPWIDPFLTGERKELDPRTRLSRHSVLEKKFPAGFRMGWEEYLWRDRLFAVHLRSVGRLAASGNAEMIDLKNFLKSLV